MFIENYGDMKIGNFLQYLMAQRLPHQFRTICQSKGHITFLKGYF